MTAPAPPRPKPPGKARLGVMLERAFLNGQDSALTREGSLSVYWRGERYEFFLNGWPIDCEKAARLLR